MTLSRREFLELVLGRYYSKEDVQDLADDYDLPVGGNKDAVIERIIVESDLDPAEAIDDFDKEELQDLCDELGIDSDGTKGRLTKRILDEVEDEEEKEESPPQPSPPPPVAPPAYSQPIPPLPPPSPAPSDQATGRRAEVFAPSPPPEVPLSFPSQPVYFQSPPQAAPLPALQIVMEFLDDYRPSRRFALEQAYEIELGQAARGRFGDEAVRVQQNILGGRIDLEILGVGIELKVPNSRNQLQTLLGQTQIYIRHYGPNLVVLIFGDLAKQQDLIEFSNLLRAVGIIVLTK